MDKCLFGQGFLPRYLFKIQFQNFKEFETAKLIKRFENYYLGTNLPFPVATPFSFYLKLYRKPNNTLLGGIGIKPDSM